MSPFQRLIPSSDVAVFLPSSAFLCSNFNSHEFKEKCAMAKTNFKKSYEKFE